MSSDLTELFEQSSLYRRWVSEAQAKGREEGLVEALRIIERRFGPLTNDDERCDVGDGGSQHHYP